MAQANALPANNAAAAPQGIWRVIIASSLGTMIEWYDFYLFGSLTAIIAPQFFGTAKPDESILLWLAAYATGFLVRPFGALVFGRVGDIIGRKYTFLVTLTIMGLSTAAIGLMPVLDPKDALFWLPAAALVGLRLLEGLALGGEYGGAATYIAEHAPAHRRGFYTSFIQITATAGLFLSVIVVLLLRNVMGLKDFTSYGWRFAFLFSLVLVALSLYIRISMRESPLFSRLKESGKTSKNPIAESFGNPFNRRLVLLALFGAVAGQGAVWYTAQFYSSQFMQNVMKVDFNTANSVVALALLLGTPFFVVMGALSDRIGRKKIILAGCLIAAICFFPIFATMYNAGPFTNPSVTDVAARVANPAYSVPILVLMIFIMVIFVTMVYGPIAAFLVELFPTKIRYTSMSLPYHIGNGWFGGLIPVLATALSLATKNLYAGLIFPITIALMTVVVGTLFVKDPTNVDLEADVEVGTSMSGTSTASAPGR